MNGSLPSNINREELAALILSLADDELILGHRDSEWTGHAPILEEDIAFSNIAQDELGHALAFYTLYEQLTGKSPDTVGFDREWKEFRCCRFVSYPKGDFAYTVVRQYLYDAAEIVRLESLMKSSYQPLRELAQRMLMEEEYHILHSSSLIERLGNATDESHRYMQAAMNEAFPQALGMFEKLASDESLMKSGVIEDYTVLKEKWLRKIIPVLTTAALQIPVVEKNGKLETQAQPDFGGRTGEHTPHLKQLIDDLQSVYRLVPNGIW